MTDQELWETIKALRARIMGLERENRELKEQNKRYKQALEFYADEETYEIKFATDTDEIFDPFTLIELDEGKKARQALEGKER